MQLHKIGICLIVSINILPIGCQSGPDPWHLDKPVSHELNDEASVPPDIRMPLRQKSPTESKLGIGEWFFKRTLAVILRGGQTKKNEDDSMDISLQMKYNSQQWNTLQEYIKSETPMTEDMFRRALDYFESSIYKPTITDQIVMAWSEYIQFYLMEYKTHITWSLTLISACLGMFWLWKHISHRHAIIIMFITFYIYEVFVSYKEAEQKELDKFLSAVDQCKWYFWTSNCDVPGPDSLVFLKHLNPMKIGIRMFTTALAEPFIVIIGVVKTILHDVTDGLWYPFDKITYAILIAFTSISLIYFLIMIIFNWILNIPFKCGFFGFNISLQQRNRTIFQEETTQQARQENADKISQATLDKILNVCSLALTKNVQTPSSHPVLLTKPSSVHSIKRSASTGRLPNNLSIENNEMSQNHLHERSKNDVAKFRIGPQNGSGDA